MSRPLRLTYRGALHHVTMRCNNKEFLFEERSQRLFLDLLRETCSLYESPLYNFCLMTNHVHLLFEVNGDDVLSRLMHRLANVFAKRFNTMRGRKGHLWEGRFLSTIVDAWTFFFRCMAYIDLNPVRAGMVREPGDYPWSAHRYLAAEDESIITLHKFYRDLAPDPKSRYAAYAKLIEEERARKPFSLAGTLFVGGQDFTRAHEERFGIAGRGRPRAKRVDLGGGVLAVGRHWGRALGEPRNVNKVPGTL